MNIDLYFPTAIGTDINKDLARQLLPYAEQYLADPKRVQKNHLNYTNTYNPADGLENLPEMAPFIKFVRMKANEYLDGLGYDSKLLTLDINIFASGMVDGDTHEQHTHPNSVLSGLMYLKTPPGSSKITFYDPRPVRTHTMLPRKHNVMPTWTELAITPEPGMILVWESWLPHSVKRTNNTDPRVTLVFNMSFRYA
jgi:uncharacterized protein (TIGR02466 family)